ncbi:MAG: cation:proton antiporter, partial [Leptospiraceae bacterium]|nr:cation:proton antiporter [Leptospiraceae bacterium]
MLIVLIIFAYIFGIILSIIGLPPMVGFLLAGFAYNLAGFLPPTGLEEIANLGITLLLFSIGLKLDLKSLSKPEIWLGSTGHIIISTLLYFGVLYGLNHLSINSIFSMNITSLLILAFAFSFSSTVFAVKVLEEKGNMYAFFGKVAIGILIMQDIFAVIFLSASEGKVPGLPALGVLALPLIRPLLFKLLDLAGHGELLVLSSLFLALGVGAGGFSLMGLKADLGALVIGILVGKHPKASELSKAFFNFKELLLVAFFVSIGLKGTPSLLSIVISLSLCLLLPIKTSLYYLILSRFGLRTRSNLLASLSLANYSEFGL